MLWMTSWIPKFPFTLRFPKKYVVKITCIKLEINNENNNNGLQFTTENETNKTVIFKSRLIRNYNNTVILDWHPQTYIFW